MSKPKTPVPARTTTEHDPHGTVATVLLMLIVLGLVALVVMYAVAS